MDKLVKSSAFHAGDYGFEPRTDYEENWSLTFWYNTQQIYHILSEGGDTELTVGRSCSGKHVIEIKGWIKQSMWVL